ncbi:MAG TPA: biotin--[acetyl-CoA-carboxylase] ligase [Candidatus Limnocylindrales bacterium]|nr:biotin--[acetyl-CoA-carboxylase] ligase [Candidatus Limnocylindrales bacterium]
MTDSFYSRIERFGEVESTQPIVRGWLADGLAEVCIATADHQTAGRGRQGRTWQAPAGAALMLSAGFRPPAALIRPVHAWRVAATLAMAMLDAAEAAAGLKDDTLWLKWPNDIVAEASDGFPRKVAGVLGEVATAGERVEYVVVGIGVNADWPPTDFPPELIQTMTSLHALSGGRPIDREQLLDEFLARLQPRYLALVDGRFDAGTWSRRQITTGRQVEIGTADGVLSGTSTGVDPASGALLLQTDAGLVTVDSGEVVRCRLVNLPRLM